LRTTISQVVEPVARAEGSVVVQDLHKWFGTFEVLQGIDLQVAPGEVVVIVGPSGSGKTTLLRCINFLEEYQRGRIIVGGKLIGAIGLSGGTGAQDNQASLAGMNAVK
jgi:polar amino acid transport system ATP-binding protein